MGYYVQLKNGDLVRERRPAKRAFVEEIVDRIIKDEGGPKRAGIVAAAARK